MKKYFLMVAVVLLSLCLLCSCSKKEDNANVPLYFNLDKGAELTPDADGAYTLRFVTDNQQKTFTVTDKALLDKILPLDFLGLTLDGDTITGITHLSDMPYYRLAWNYFVQSVGGNNVKLNSSKLFAGNEVLLELPEDLKIYDYAPLSTNPGSITELTKNDRVSVIADRNDNLVCIYVTDRAMVLGTEKLPCQHCESDVLWYDWLSDSSLPTAPGHYKLTKDVSLLKGVSLGNASICLDLNGKTVSQSAFGKRIISMQGGGTLSIMDTVGGGKFVPNSTKDGQDAKWGMIFYITSTESTLNLYGGTLDASNCTAQYGCAVNITSGTFNMYGGEILGGSAYGTGGTAVTTSGNFSMYDGRIVGGKIVDIGFDSINEEGGATLRVSGLATIYGGTIEGGESLTSGGVIRVGTDIATGNMGKLVLKGGTITGGKAPKAGGIYATDTSSVTISGNVRITDNENGNLWVHDLAKVYIGEEGLGEDALIGISMTNPGDFLYGVPEGTDVTKHFVSDNASQKLVKSGADGWALK